MNPLDTQYINLLHDIKNYGEWEENRTGIRAKTIPSAMIQHDMAKGFPMLTIKRVPFKTMAVELEGFIHGVTSKKWYQDRGCKIWNEWCNPEKVPYGNDEATKKKMLEEDDLGPIYGWIWRHWPNTESNLVKPQETRDSTPKGEFYPTEQQLNGNISFNDEIADFLPHEKLNGEILGKISRGKNSIWAFRFRETGSIISASRCNLRSGQAKDPYEKALFGVACIGRAKPDEKLYTLWRNMIVRCYNDKSPVYKWYGEKGIYVSPDWLCFENFQNTISQVGGYYLWQQNPNKYSFDKDYYNSKSYDFRTCVFLKTEDNTQLNGASCQTDDGIFVSYKECAKYYNIDGRRLSEHVANKRVIEVLKFKNFKTLKEKFVKIQEVDQLSKIVHFLKKDPTNRRMLCTTWCPSLEHMQAIPPCHFLWGVSVIGGKLNLFWTQRSVDVPLGLPFNIASYGLLLHLLAKEAGLKEGTLTGFLNNVHFYENQLDGVNEILSRETDFDLPQIVTMDINSIFEWNHQGSKLENYQFLPTVKMPVAV